MIRFVLTVESKQGGQAAYHSLRWLLKRLRDRGLKCIDAREECTAATEISNQAADGVQKLRDEIIAARATETDWPDDDFGADTVKEVKHVR
jgi:hypothetical protein